ncbi:3-hydroxyacyl-ACP dehydratase FabZ [Lactobacillus sp. ESL0684]|uniref:3-hydroxyacyl-ACP dehydratase FabZ n=1 Tax=unclassified Lactobacillus TaxID=2620435 RepID=UPI0023F9F8DD|nr:MULTISPECIES: 3-hydroxyacyl-ACP dehydratase FabZ [unclassified Lactobacillus]WEV40500.1 3-hydroxyacyl-ACP dehydratase FabZ [Lactobacillus sp. ESL0681]WEV43047.1 3-hydroxyacyl-ACP dehydratase FabZ [Lactobacillus sp. ESL0684]
MEEQVEPQTLDIMQIEQILPHRFPMLLIDQVLDYQAGQYAIARKNLTINESFFQGHFPDNPVMPGVLMVEALAQTGAIALLTLPEFAGKTAYFGGIKNARFRQMAKPGDSLRLEVQLEKLRGNAGVGKAKAYLGQKLACNAELTFAIQ